MTSEESSVQIKVDGNSRIPKYQQIIKSIIEDIENGTLKVGQKIPSINELSEDHYLSRDTVEKAYKKLKEQKIIVSAKGKGYYIAKTELISRTNVLLLVNKLSSYKMRIYNAFVSSLGPDAHVDLRIYHCDEKLFLNILDETFGGYDYYVVMSHFVDANQSHQGYTDATLKALKKIPTEKLILMDNDLPELNTDYAAVYQDFKNEIYDALEEGIDKLKKYSKLILVFPEKAVYPYPKDILHGIRNFCISHKFDFEVLGEIYPEMELHKNDAYIIIEENDLVNLVKQIRDSSFQMGNEIGVISYNDTPLKDLLGITCVTTDFMVMGETAAYMIKKKKREKIRNVFSFIDRDSI